MFFLAIPAISAAVSWVLSRWLTALRGIVSAACFEGLLLVMAPLVVFSLLTAKRQNAA